MLKNSRMLSLVTAGALLAVPATALATGTDHKGKGKGHDKPAQSCAKTHNVGFVVSGTLVSVIADNPATAASEATVTLTVTGANRHAKKSGELADMDAATPGVQVKGATYTVAAGDAYTLKLKQFEGTDTPSPGDRVHVIGKVALKKARCAPANTTVADLYGAVNVKKVSIADRDADA